jgi:hypothetical protein
VLVPDQPVRTVWRWARSGNYSAHSAMFHGQTELLGAKCLWKSKARVDFKFLFWLTLQERCWTAQRCHHHGMDGDASCALCSQNEESIDHLLLGCVFSREVWTRMLQPLGRGHVLPVPDADSRLNPWWVDARKRIAKPRHRAFDSLVILIVRRIWLEWNARVFNWNSCLLDALSVSISGTVKD